jgi:hypothetical protein
MRPSRLLESAAAPLAGATAAAFAGLSAARRKRVFHPRGHAFEATVSFGVVRDLPFHGSHDALVRLSRGVGLPERAPDVLGIAVKIPALGQDLLLASSGEGRLTRHLLIPVRGFFTRPYSTVLPYELDGRLVVFGARAAAGLDDIAGDDLDAVTRLAEEGRVRFDLTWAETGSDEVSTFGSLELHGPHDGDLSFNPFNTYGTLKPAGALNRLRRDSYASSQKARPDSEYVAGTASR